MPQPTLPPELIGAIVKKLGEVNSATVLQALCACCLVGSVMLPFGREELYQHVDIRVNENLEGQRGADLRPPPPRKLLSTLTSSAHLGRLVRQLDLIAGLRPDQPEAQDLARDAIGACAEVHELNLYLWEGEPSSGWLEEVVMGLQGKLLSLGLEGEYTWHPTRFAEMLERVPALRDLQIYSLDGIDLLPKPAQLHLESFSVGDHLDVDLLAQLIGTSCGSLNHLSLVGFGLGQSFDFTHYTNLTSLSLTTPLSHLGKEDLRLLLASVSSIPSLHSAAFFSLLGRREPLLSHLEHLRILHLLPPTLHELIQTDWMPFSTSYLLSAFADERCLPALKHIELSCGVLEGGEHVQYRPREELEQIKRAADARGIKIVWSEPWEDLGSAYAYDFEEQGDFID